MKKKVGLIGTGLDRVGVISLEFLVRFLLRIVPASYIPAEIHTLVLAVAEWCVSMLTK